MLTIWLFPVQRGADVGIIRRENDASDGTIRTLLELAGVLKDIVQDRVDHAVEIRGRA